MNGLRQQTLEMRRRELVERSTAQRAALARGIAPLIGKAAVVDRAIGSVRRYPLVSAGLAAAVVLLGGRRLFDVVVRGVTLYTLLRRS